MSTRPPRRARRLLLVIPLLLVGGLVWGWWYMASGRFPLAGDMSHDFGTVAITGSTSSFSHTFHLRNRRSHPVVIESIRSGCGCTKAEASTKTVAPGAPVDIDVTLSLARAGSKRTSVKLVIADFGPQTLWIQAVGRKETVLTSPTSNLRLAPDAPARLIVTAEIQSTDAPPPAPTILTPEGVIASFRGWTAVNPREPATARAARWRGVLDVERSGPLPAGRSEMTVGLNDAPPVRVRISG